MLSPVRIGIDGKMFVPNPAWFILNSAKVSKGIVVSNDEFKEFVNNKELAEFINYRVVMYMMFKNQFVPAGEPQGKGGPSLVELM